MCLSLSGGTGCRNAGFDDGSATRIVRPSCSDDDDDDDDDDVEDGGGDDDAVDDDDVDEGMAVDGLVMGTDGDGVAVLVVVVVGCAVAGLLPLPRFFFIDSFVAICACNRSCMKGSDSTWSTLGRSPGCLRSMLLTRSRKSALYMSGMGG